MTKKPLRRKGQGKTQRPICANCLEDLDRSYIRALVCGKQQFIPNGWECTKCKLKDWD